MSTKVEKTAKSTTVAGGLGRAPGPGAREHTGGRITAWR